MGTIYISNSPMAKNFFDKKKLGDPKKSCNQMWHIEMRQVLCQVSTFKDLPEKYVMNP